MNHAKNRIASAPLSTSIADDVIILAVPYAAVSSVVQHFGSQFSGKVLVDITNPLNETYDGYITPSDSSAAEEIAKIVPPQTHVIKAFNTTFAGTLVKGEVAEQKLDVFIAGDDLAAKTKVSTLINESGLRVIDVGPLHRSHLLEAMALLGITLQGPLGTGFKSAWKLLS